VFIMELAGMKWQVKRDCLKQNSCYFSFFLLVKAGFKIIDKPKVISK